MALARQGRQHGVGIGSELGQLAVLARERFVAVDVGAAKGLLPHWESLEGVGTIYQIEPRDDACEELRGLNALRRHPEGLRVLNVALSENRALAIMVMSNREIQNRVVQLERYYSSEELRRAANYLNEAFAGRSLPDVRAQLVKQMQETRQHMDQLMQDAIQMAQKVFDTEPDGRVEYVIAGETNLMGFAELSNVDRLRRLFKAFNEKHDILRLLDSCLRADGIQIFIGHESGYQILDDCSVVTAPYASGDAVVGVLGVIGPTRMAYERVIPIVDMTAKLLGAALNSRR